MTGKSGRIFFLVLVVVTHLHQFCRVWLLFPVLESSLRCSSTALTGDRFMPVSWRQGQGVGSGRAGSGNVGTERVAFLFLVFALDFERSSSLSLLGTGQFTVLQGPCFAIRFPASGSYGFVITRPQQCQFVFRCTAIISLFLLLLPCDPAEPGLGRTPAWPGSRSDHGLFPGRSLAEGWLLPSGILNDRALCCHLHKVLPPQCPSL